MERTRKRIGEKALQKRKDERKKEEAHRKRHGEGKITERERE